MRKLALLLLLVLPLLGQPTSTARRIVHGTTVPSTCTAGDIFFSTTNSSAYVCASADTWVVGASSSGSAPSNATYITKQAETGLSAEQSLGALTTGLVKNTVSAGVGTLSTAVAGTDFVGGHASLTTQYAVPYVSATTGVLDQGSLYQCSSGLVGLDGCTISYPGFRRYSTTSNMEFKDATGATYIGISANTGTFYGTLLTTGRMYSYMSTVTYSATPTFTASSYNSFKITLTGNVTSSTLSGASAGQHLRFLIYEDGTGGHAFVWPPEIKGGMSIVTDANTWNMQTFFCDGTYCYAESAGSSGT